MIHDFQDATWREKPEYIRKYYDLLPSHIRLCDEVEYILTTELVKARIEYAHVTSRAKTLRSFCEKIYRKSYKNPFTDITDLAGLRVVYLYLSDRVDIETIIEKEFDVIDKLDKVTEKDAEVFGYGALHYIAKIKKKHSGARYDDIKNLVCEIQVRTILQDAWAIVAHHLSYKQESDIPKELRRKLNALSGLFETADDQFEQIRLARNEYKDKLKANISKKKDVSLEQEINLDNLAAFIKWKFPDREDSDPEDVSMLLSELKTFGYKRLVDIDNVINKSKRAVLEYEKDEPPSEIGSPGFLTNYNGVGLIRTSLLFIDTVYYKTRYGVLGGNIIEKYNHLIL